MAGTVRDESGTVLPGVTVTVTQTDTGFTRTVVTGGAGAYALPNLPIGPYKLDASLQGFRSYSRTGIVLQVSHVRGAPGATGQRDHGVLCIENEQFGLRTLANPTAEPLGR